MPVALSSPRRFETSQDKRVLLLSLDEKASRTIQWLQGQKRGGVDVALRTAQLASSAPILRPIVDATSRADQIIGRIQTVVCAFLYIKALEQRNPA
jgi:hypothetical protein